MSWTQTYDPLGQPWLSTLCAALPVVALLGSLAFLQLRAHIGALVGLGTSLADGDRRCSACRVSMALASAAYGAAFGLLPIGWIVLNVIFLYQLTAERGLFATLRQSITHVTTDARLQLLLVAFAFGAFFEGAAGFGTPVAVTGALLIGLGFAPLAASGLSLIANTAPVAFGALGTPLIALSAVSGLDLQALSGMVGRQLPFFSVLVPFWLIGAFAGWRGMLGIWPAILVAGVPFAVAAVPRLELARAVARRRRRLDRVDGRARALPARLAPARRLATRADASARGMDEGAAMPSRDRGRPRMDAVDHPERRRVRLGAAAGEGGARRMDDGAHSCSRAAQPRAARASRGARSRARDRRLRAVLAVRDRHRHLRRGDPRRTWHGLLARGSGAHVLAHAYAWCACRC